MANWTTGWKLLRCHGFDRWVRFSFTHEDGPRQHLGPFVRSRQAAEYPLPDDADDDVYDADPDWRTG